MRMVPGLLGVATIPLSYLTLRALDCRADLLLVLLGRVCALVGMGYGFAGLGRAGIVSLRPRTKNLIGKVDDLRLTGGGAGSVLGLDFRLEERP